MTFYSRDGRAGPELHDMTTGGQGSNSRLNSARMQQGSAENADRLLAERRSSSAVSHSDMAAEHYAERAARKEADQRQAEEDIHWENVRRERDEQNDAVRGFEIEDPHPHPLGLPAPNDPDADLNTAYFETLAWEKRREDYLTRAEGEELAARITTGILRPWTR
ncbi:hypothetical protein [Streptomyces sp. PTY087I2]|uniref:hypothetical protein n=1 Tax=Streptomyces sp. PTY087I2 TaxID=1819298 RepID=UPI000828164A|nr:hypothetical protein [Streptomyces sp. PTY087I2]OCC07524.1 hypothetical protein A3Q37_06688 [Streptomyces sp. PTY087I2]